MPGIGTPVFKFNRDQEFIGDPASIRTLALSPLRFLMSVVPCVR